jgi:hypothetical protein
MLLVDQSFLMYIEYLRDLKVWTMEKVFELVQIALQSCESQVPYLNQTYIFAVGKETWWI